MAGLRAAAASEFGERLGDVGVERLVGGGMAAADRIGLVMQMTGRQVRMQRDFVGAAEAQMEDAGLRMVEPDHGVEM